MVNFEFFGKALILMLVFAFSLFYIYYLRPNQKDTPFLLVGMLRTFLYFISRIFIWIFPLLIFFMYPQVRLDVILQFMLLFYMIGFWVFGFILLLNIFWVGPVILMHYGGFNPMKKKTTFFLDQLLGKKVMNYANKLVKNNYKNQVKSYVNSEMNEYLSNENGNHKNNQNGD